MNSRFLPRLLMCPAVLCCAVLPGPCSFSMSCDFRTSGLPQAAASYIIAPHGPTLKGEGQYSLPPGESSTACVDETCLAGPLICMAQHTAPSIAQDNELHPNWHSPLITQCFGGMPLPVPLPV